MWLKSSPSWSQKIILQPFEVVNLNENEVSKMNKMPGFTAETSFYVANEYYKKAGINSASANDPGVVQPAQSLADIDPCSDSCKCCGRSANAWCCKQCDVC